QAGSGLESACAYSRPVLRRPRRTPPSSGPRPILRPGSRARRLGMLTRDHVRRVAIVGGVRIPFARSMGAYAEAGNQDMLTAALKGLVERFGLRGERLG